MSNFNQFTKKDVPLSAHQFRTPLSEWRFRPLIQTPKTPELSLKYVRDDEIGLSENASDSIKMKLTFDSFDASRLQDEAIPGNKKCSGCYDGPVTIDKSTGMCEINHQSQYGEITNDQSSNKVLEPAHLSSGELVHFQELKLTGSKQLIDDTNVSDFRVVDGRSGKDRVSQGNTAPISSQENAVCSDSKLKFSTAHLDSKFLKMPRSLSEQRHTVKTQVNKQVAWANIRQILQKKHDKLPSLSSEDEEDKNDGKCNNTQKDVVAVPPIKDSPHKTESCMKKDFLAPKPPLKRVPLSTVSQEMFSKNKENIGHSYSPALNSVKGLVVPTSNHKYQHQQNNCTASKDSNSQVGRCPSKVESKGSGSASMPLATVGCDSELRLQRIIVNGKAYQVINLLGKGGSSKVYQAMDETNRIIRAVKTVDLSEADQHSQVAYRKEVEFLLKLNDCQCVIKMIDYEYKENDKILYIVMEKGDSDMVQILRELSSGKDQLDSILIKVYWSQMLKAVEEIHKRGIIHSDLKPANFMLVNGKLKLIDFGIASNIQTDMTSVIKETQVGTINYMSPESLFSTTSYSHPGVIKVRPKSDVWSLGCILYNLTYGYTPFQSIKNVMQKMQAISNPNFEIPFPPCNDVFLRDVLKKCLQRDPAKRPDIPQLLAHPYLTLPSGNVQTLVESLKAACSPNSLIQVSKSLQVSKVDKS